jgi:DNA-binding transcriptional MerR regulator
MSRTEELWTVGQLSHRTGIPIKAIRDYTDDGLG